MRRALVGLAVAALLSAACSDGDDAADTTTTTSAASSPTTAAPGSQATAPPAPVKGVKLTQLARLDQPTAMALRPGDNAVYIAEKTGRVRRLVDFRPAGGPVIDVSGNLSLGGEQGLLGLAFSPDGRTAYINYSDAKGDTHIASHDMENNDPRQLSDLLFVNQPFPNHNGGQLAFGPDGRLYAGLGDGGSQNDPRNNAQNPDSNLGKILRFDTSAPSPQPEKFALGLRNPWRFSFDRANGDLWIADVGATNWEEIDVDRAPVDAGRNYGWPQREGAHRNKSGTAPNAVDPEHEYDHEDGSCSVTGGYVYRGAALKSLLDGVYVFADYCKGDLMGLRNGKAEDLKVHVEAPSSFGEDAAGELYVLSLRGPVYRIEAAP